MSVIKLYPCKTKIELEIEEEKCRKELQATLNHYRCHITEEDKIEYYKEYYENNKEQLLKQQKDYCEANKEKILEKSKEKIDCICGKTFMYCNKARHEKSVKHQTFINK